jgi:hypothetical protein
MAAEREIEPQVLEILEDFQPKAERAVRKGEQPDYEPLTTALMAIFVPFFTEIATEEALRVSAEIGIQFDPAIINQQALTWAQRTGEPGDCIIHRYAGNDAGRHNETARANVRAGAR